MPLPLSDNRRVQTPPSSIEPSAPNPAPTRLPRALYVMVGLLIITHTSFNGIRIATSLAAIKAGGGALWVGILTAMFNLVPAFLAIYVGRRVDRLPLRKPLVFGCLLAAAGGLVAAWQPMLWVLALCASAIGIGWMVIAAASQYAVGSYGSEAGSSELRVKAFSIMAMGFSVSSFLGPLIAGFMIDHVSFAAAFGVLAVLPLIAAAAFWSKRLLKLPSIAGKVADAPTGSASELLAVPIVRNTLITGAFITIGWDLYLFMVPVLGTELKLTATQIGSVLSLFAVAVFAVRFMMPWLSKKLGERGVIVTAMVLAGSTFVAFAFAHSYSLMLVLSFIIGLGLGAAQPIVLSLLHGAAPPHRIGEVNGLRMTMISTSQWTMPLVFGVLSLTTGMLPLFLVVGGGLLSGSFFAKKKLPKDS
ncbi:MAG: MFS transporter [Betaproteobacteria bacterium]|nr:MAG: MFS transporter [Betaproteobacteria bacterium]